jgi:hypothetical protein
MIQRSGSQRAGSQTPLLTRVAVFRPQELGRNVERVRKMLPVPDPKRRGVEIDQTPLCKQREVG